MKKSKGLFWAVSVPVWVLALIIAIKAVVDTSPENPLRKYAFIIVIGFISITGVLRIIYKKVNK